ncbi:hypothetical protein M8J76_004355 [Diaphorina citri]|nr:hypothetical protein M8J76_004355 [Diaphorina citri]
MSSTDLENDIETVYECLKQCVKTIRHMDVPKDELQLCIQWLKKLKSPQLKLREEYIRRMHIELMSGYLCPPFNSTPPESELELLPPAHTHGSSVLSGTNSTMSCCTMNSENHPDTERRAFDMIHNSKSAKTKKMRSEPNMKNKFHLEASHHYSEHIHNLGSQMGDGPYTNVNKDIAIEKMKELWDNSEEINKIYDKLYEKDEEDFAVSLMKTISEETTTIKKSSELITNQNNDKTCHNVINSETIADAISNNHDVLSDNNENFPKQTNVKEVENFPLENDVTEKPDIDDITDKITTDDTNPSQDKLLEVLEAKVKTLILENQNLNMNNEKAIKKLREDFESLQFKIDNMEEQAREYVRNDTRMIDSNNRNRAHYAKMIQDLQQASETHRAEYSKKIEDLTDLVKCLLDQLLFQLDNLSSLDIKFHRFTHDYAQDKKQSNFRIKSVETSQRQFLSDLIRRQRGEVKQLEHLIQYYRHIMDEKKQEIHELENHLGKLV